MFAGYVQSFPKPPPERRVWLANELVVPGGVGILLASTHAFTGNSRSDDFMLHRHGLP
jgi:hypothetical protein